jgi:carbon storage regulator CsrA
MLILSRHIDEGVTLTIPDGRRIVVTLVKIQRDTIRLGFEAPEDVRIHRNEVQKLVDTEDYYEEVRQALAAKEQQEQANGEGERQEGERPAAEAEVEAETPET